MPSIIRSGLAVALAVLLGRLLGFGREATIAATFGISQQADVAVFLIGLPDFLINVLGAGGFTAILVIAYRQRPGQAARLMMQAGLSVLAGITLLAVLMIAFRGVLTDLLAPGFVPEARQLAIDLLPPVLLSAPVAAMTGAAIAFLQARDRFFIAASGTAIINITLIAALVIAPDGEALATLAGAVLLAAILRWLLLALAIGRESFRGLSTRPWLVDRALVAAFGRSAVSESVVFLYPFALNALTTLYGIGALAAVSYATKLVQLPLGALMMTMTTILLPRMAQAAPREGAGDAVRFERLVRSGMVWMAIIGIISMAILVFEGTTLARLTFGWGAIPPEGLERIGTHVGVLALMLVPMGLNNLMRRTLNALGDTRVALRAELAGFAVFLVLALLSVVLSAPQDVLLATVSVGHLAAGLVLAGALRQRGVRVGRMLAAPESLRTLVLVAVATLTPLLLLALFAPSQAGIEVRALVVAFAGAAGVLAAVLGTADGRQVLTRLRRRR
ncbi:MAG: lipid II flippase MurJ [Pseudomonadota bacterium]|nr:lipid II flippase MurJ [Pseudomonadota bacterium]